MSQRVGRRAAALAIAGAAVAVTAIACIAALLSMQGKAAFPESSPLAVEGQTAECRWPEVDWAYWQEVNPDVVGWVSIPGTNVSQPIVQAQKEAPDYYLTHDVYGNWNLWGAVYLDADCEEGLLVAPNAVVYGHHMDDGTMFAQVASYSDASWASEHATVLIQTPDDRRPYKLRYTDVVDNRSLPKRTEFLDKTDFDAWYADGLATAAAAVDAKESPEQTVSLVTCSYRMYSDERTVAVCSEDFSDPDVLVSDGSKALGPEDRKALVHDRVWSEGGAS